MFAQKVKPTTINIYETFHGGAVVAVYGKDDRGDWVPFWNVSAPQDLQESRIFSPPIQVSFIRLYTNMNIRSFENLH